jgi:hypothetical protein
VDGRRCFNPILQITKVLHSLKKASFGLVFGMLAVNWIVPCAFG